MVVATILLFAQMMFGTPTPTKAQQGVALTQAHASGIVITDQQIVY